MGTKEPFGGVSIITVGDLFQLKPVFDHWIFENSKDGYTALATNLWQQYFQMFELSEVMRQRVWGAVCKKTTEYKPPYFHCNLTYIL